MSRGVERSRGESNRQAPAKSRRNCERLTTRAAPGAARSAARVSQHNITSDPAEPTTSTITTEPSFAQLARLVAAWPDLPADVREQIAGLLDQAAPPT